MPPNFVLGTSVGSFRQVPLLLIDLETKEGVTGRSYVFCYLRAAAPAITSLLGEVEHVVKDAAINPAGLWAKLAQRFTLIGVQGIVRIAMAGFDIACWDALAIAAGTPLATFLNATDLPLLEYIDWADVLLEGPLIIAKGYAVVPVRSGNGMIWDKSAVEHYRMR